MPCVYSAGCRYRISGASVTGPSHQSDNILCEDAWEGMVFGETGAVIAVADGLGSARHGGTGATVAVSAAINAISAYFDPLPDGGGCKADHETNHMMVRAACRAARKAIVSHASAAGISFHAFACTLIVVLWHGNAIIAARIGDGAIVCLQGEGHVLLSAPQERRYVNEVVPLTDENYEGACVVSPELSGVTACAVFTDGCERLFLEKKCDGYHPYEPFFLPFFPAVEPLLGTAEGDCAIRELLESDTFISFSEDDKTLVVVMSDEGSDEYRG